ncbi:MAG TPA: hypothetical protein VFR47_02430 [Anaerolineales bacterium]|nr:hypothetical protein [Anaerolineales bacterium]
MEIARGFGVFLPICVVGSNVAEYLALIEGLEALADLRIGEAAIEIRGDAKCVIDQMLRYAPVSSPLTRTLKPPCPKTGQTLHLLEMGLGAAPHVFTARYRADELIYKGDEDTLIWRAIPEAKRGEGYRAVQRTCVCLDIQPLDFDAEQVSCFVRTIGNKTFLV